jgi:hypothetical protein
VSANLSYNVQPGASMVSSFGLNASLAPPTMPPSMTAGANYPGIPSTPVITPATSAGSASSVSHRLRGAVSHMEGPPVRHYTNTTSLFSSLHSSVDSQLPGVGDVPSVVNSVQTSLFGFNPSGRQLQVSKYSLTPFKEFLL